MTITHAADLIERHAITMPAPDPAPDPSLLPQVRQRAWNRLMQVAERWAAAEDVAIECEPFETQYDDGTPRTWGVRFTVVVGRGTEAVDPDTPAPPWDWSARWQAWGETFRIMARPELKLITNAQVIDLRPPTPFDGVGTLITGGLFGAALTGLCGEGADQSPPGPPAP